METMERTEQSDLTFVNEEVLTLRKRNRMLVWLALALAAAVVALGVWAVVSDDGSTATEPIAEQEQSATTTPAEPATTEAAEPATSPLTAEREQMIDTINAYLQALNEGDGEAAAALMVPGGYHDNGRRYFVEDGELADFINGIADRGFSVRSSAFDRDVDFVGNYVVTSDYIPETSSIERPSFYRMTADGDLIIWHYAP